MYAPCVLVDKNSTEAAEFVLMGIWRGTCGRRDFVLYNMESDKSVIEKSRFVSNFTCMPNLGFDLDAAWKSYKALAEEWAFNDDRYRKRHPDYVEGDITDDMLVQSTGRARNSSDSSGADGATPLRRSDRKVCSQFRFN